MVHIDVHTEEYGTVIDYNEEKQTLKLTINLGINTKDPVSMVAVYDVLNATKVVELLDAMLGPYRESNRKPRGFECAEQALEMFKKEHVKVT